MFKDDWGSQASLLISPRHWRKLFKPLYADYCRIIHDAGKFAFFHSDGHIAAIFPDLIEIGVDAVNSQLFCMDIEALAREYKGQITLWGEIDRQQALAFGTPQDVRQAVRRVRRAFDDGSGQRAQCEWANDTHANIKRSSPPGQNRWIKLRNRANRKGRTDNAENSVLRRPPDGTDRHTAACNARKSQPVRHIGYPGQ